MVDASRGRCVATIHSSPEDARRFCVGKEANACKVHVKRRGLNRGKRSLHLLYAGFADFANKLQGDVQSFHAGPARFRAPADVRVPCISLSRARTSAGISSAIKMRMLHQLAPDHIQGLLRGPVAYAVTIAGESALDHFCMAAVGQRMEDQTDGLFVRSARRAGYTR